MESPGLTAAPAIAVDAVRLVQEAGLELVPKADFQPRRQRIVRFRNLSHEERAKLVKENPLYGRMICRCESVTEGEIRMRSGVELALSMGSNSGQGWSRALPGRLCGPTIMSIIARELNIPFEEVGKRGPGTELVAYHAKELLTGGKGQKVKQLFSRCSRNRRRPGWFSSCLVREGGRGR